MANNARLILRRLIVERGNARSRKVRRRRMALHAHGVHVGAIEQARIRSAVWCVAGSAPLGLYNVMLIDKRARRLGMALDANSVLLGGRLEALLFEGAVRIVAVGALHQPLVHFVVEGHGELRLDVGVALVAERRLCSLQQRIFFAGMNVMAADAAYVPLTMCRALEVGMLAVVAALAHTIHFIRRRLDRVKDLGGIAAAFNVRLAGSMACLAGDSGLAMLLGQFAVRIGTEPLRLRFMAAGANLRTHKIPRCRILGLHRGGFGWGRSERHGAQNSSAQHQY